MATGLGNLCPHNHDHEGTGMSLRYIVKRRGTATGSCVVCRRLANKKNRGNQTKAREAKAKAQGRSDGKYQGTPCKRGHSGLRYVLDGSCVACERQRRRETAQSPQRKEYERARKRKQNLNRALEPFDEEFHSERAALFELESSRRKILKLVREKR